MNKLPNILSNTQRFDIFVDEEMLEKKFEMWPADLFSDTTFVIVDMYVINLGYLKDRFSYFIELLDNSIQESNRILVGLNTTTDIPETNNQDLLHLIDLEAKWTNKKKEKAEKC